MQISKTGVDLIKNFEGFRDTSYECQAGVWTIGYGTTGPEVKPNQKITKEEAERLLTEDIKYFEGVVSEALKTSINQNQFDALVSFTYNVGASAFRSSTLLKLLNNQASQSVVAAEFLKWVKADGKVSEGLKNRREKERQLFLTKPLHPLLSSSILAEHDTWLKREPKQSSELAAEQKLFVPKGSAHKWDAITMVPGEIDYKVTLSAQPDRVWWFYPPHWKIINDPKPSLSQPTAPVATPKTGAITLPIPYFSQRDNARDPLRTCFSSSCAMMLAGLRPGVIKSDDEYINTVFKYGDTTAYTSQIEALEDYGVKATFSQNGAFSNIDSQLELGIAVPIGILHKGPVTSPTGGGHWITVIGRNAEGSAYIVHDPFGDLDLVGGTYISTNGKSLSYSKKNLAPRWMVEGAFTGWYIKGFK
jgi:GH24 family phage-related lysozyme (muramidase)